MKEFIACTDCAFMAKNYGIGFCSEVTMHCIARDNEEVTCEDGCTLGCPGEHFILKADCEVVISDSHIAAYGCEYE